MFSFKKMHVKMSSGKWRPFCICLNVLRALLVDPVCSQQQPPWEAKKCIVDIEKSIQIIYQNIGQIGFILTILIIYVNTRCKIILSPQ